MLLCSQQKSLVRNNTIYNCLAEEYYLRFRNDLSFEMVGLGVTEVVRLD